MSGMTKAFWVKVRYADDGAFTSQVYAIDGHSFLLYNKETGFGWYDFNVMRGLEPAVTLVDEAEIIEKAFDEIGNEDDDEVMQALNKMMGSIRRSV